VDGQVFDVDLYQDDQAPAARREASGRMLVGNEFDIN